MKPGSLTAGEFLSSRFLPRKRRGAKEEGDVGVRDTKNENYVCLYCPSVDQRSSYTITNEYTDPFNLPLLPVPVYLSAPLRRTSVLVHSGWLLDGRMMLALAEECQSP